MSKRYLLMWEPTPGNTEIVMLEDPSTELVAALMDQKLSIDQLKQELDKFSFEYEHRSRTVAPVDGVLWAEHKVA